MPILANVSAPPASHHDPLRLMSVDQLNMLTDPDLVHQALQLLTIDNVDGSVRLPDGSAVSLKACIIEFAANSKTREGRDIQKQLPEKVDELKDIAVVEKFKNKQNDDDSDEFFVRNSRTSRMMMILSSVRNFIID